ncbi:MAG: inositol monophosphatase family protein [Patescibacteria group bacterium]|jgi:myo-inositol-1(or 4)-monophosphatase
MKEFAIGLVLRAGNILMREFRKLAPEQIRFKQQRELVTKHDLSVDKFMVDKIRSAYPDHAVLSEEEGFRKRSKSDYMWVVDPLDGTTNYIMRHTFFATTLAILKRGEPILGIIYAPYTRELFVAEKGKGAFKNEERIHVSNENNLTKSFVTFAYSHEPQSLKRAISAYQHFEFESRSMRHFGSSSLELAFVAAGRVEAQIITPPVRIWDVAAGVLMVKEAGGKVTDFHGNSSRIAYNGLVASNSKVHNKILQVIKKKKI